MHNLYTYLVAYQQSENVEFTFRTFNYHADAMEFVNLHKKNTGLNVYLYLRIVE